MSKKPLEGSSYSHCIISVKYCKLGIIFLLKHKIKNNNRKTKNFSFKKSDGRPAGYWRS